MRYLLIIVLIFVSCKSKRPITENVTKIDTVKVFKDRIIEKPIEKLIKIEEPCDSIGLRPFEKEIITKYVKVNVKGERDTIFIKTNIDSIVQERIVTEKLKWESSTKEIPVKYIPKFIKILAWLGGALVLLIILKVLKPFIPLLKFLPF